MAAPDPQTPLSLRDITVRIARPEAPSVDLHVTQRAGEIQVSVRTPDPVLQTSLRQDLNTLTTSLERAGYRTDAVAPRGEVSSQINTRQMNSGQTNTGDDHPPQQESSGRDASSDSRDRRQQPQQQQQNPRDQRASRWLDELELTK